MDATRIDAAIDRLDADLRAAGFEGLTPATDLAALEELEREIAPYALPPDLRRFWERFELSSLRVRGWRLPELCDPEAALATHRQNLAEVPLMFGPPLLLPLARISGDQWSIELVSDRSPGGMIVSHEDVGPMTVEYPSFLDLVEVYAELLEEGRFERQGEGYGSFGLDDERAKQEERIAAAWPHPVYGDAREIPADPAGWPAHWLEPAGIDLRDREPRGATHTIGELVEASQRGPVEGRINGEIVRLAGSSNGTIALVSDGDVSIAVFCPPDAWTGGQAQGRSYEFELAVVDPVPPPSEPPAGPEGAVLRLFDGHAPAALATAIRPLG